MIENIFLAFTQAKECHLPSHHGIRRKDLGGSKFSSNALRWEVEILWIRTQKGTQYTLYTYVCFQQKEEGARESAHTPTWVRTARRKEHLPYPSFTNSKWTFSWALRFYNNGRCTQCACSDCCNWAIGQKGREKVIIARAHTWACKIRILKGHWHVCMCGSGGGGGRGGGAGGRLVVLDASRTSTTEDDEAKQCTIVLHKL